MSSTPTSQVHNAMPKCCIPVFARITTEVPVQLDTCMVSPTQGRPPHLGSGLLQ